jgi:hypothetical protein
VTFAFLLEARLPEFCPRIGACFANYLGPEPISDLAHPQSRAMLFSGSDCGDCYAYDCSRHIGTGRGTVGEASNHNGCTALTKRQAQPFCKSSTDA